MSPLFQNLPPRTKTVLLIEIVVGVVILLGGIFLLATEGKAPSPSPVASVGKTSTYISSVLQIQLKYPYGWQRDEAYTAIEGLERFASPDGQGFFRVDASNSAIPKKNQIIIKYTKPIMIGETEYKNFVLEVDPAHIQTIKESIVFF